MKLRPYHEGEALKVESFLAQAKSVHGDKDLTPKGHHALYLAEMDGELVGLLETRVCAVSGIHGDRPALLLSKLLFSPEYFEDEYALLGLNFFLSEAQRLAVEIVFIEGDEMPYEKELGFVPAASLGLYDGPDPVAYLNTLRAKRLDGSDKLAPGFLYLI